MVCVRERERARDCKQCSSGCGLVLPGLFWCVCVCERESVTIHRAARIVGLCFWDYLCVREREGGRESLYTVLIRLWDCASGIILVRERERERESARERGDYTQYYSDCGVELSGLCWCERERRGGGTTHSTDQMCFRDYLGVCVSESKRKTIHSTVRIVGLRSRDYLCVRETERARDYAECCLDAGVELLRKSCCEGVCTCAHTLSMRISMRISMYIYVYMYTHPRTICTCTHTFVVIRILEILRYSLGQWVSVCVCM